MNGKGKKIKKNIDAGEIILIDKPPGMTSFDLIRILRQKTGIRKMGHSGTLDPMATGLLIIATGKKTKELSKLIKLSKEYIAEVLFGKKTDTGDITGSVTEEVAVNKISLPLLEKTLLGMLGEIELAVPLYSAIKVSGKRLYKIAISGRKVEPPKRTMALLNFEVIEVKENKASIKMIVKSGTYIRSLAEELGRRMKIPATLSGLRRTSIGTFSVSEAISI